MSDAMRLPEPPGAAGHGRAGHHDLGGHNGFSAFGGPGGPGDLDGFTGHGGSGGHDDLRMAVGALALDALDEQEARLVRAHLAGCPECEAEYQSFVGVRGILDVALVGGIPRAERHQAHAERDPARTPARVVGRRPRNSGVAAPARAPRRRRLAIALSGAAAALVVSAAGVTGALIGSSGGSAATVAQGTPAPVEQLAPATNGFGVTASIRYQQVNWGTWVQITMSNVPADYSCTLLAYDKQGREYAVSSWRSAEGQKTVTAPGAVALSPGEIDHFEVDMGPQEWSLSIPMTS